MKCVFFLLLRFFVPIISFLSSLFNYDEMVVVEVRIMMTTSVYCVRILVVDLVDLVVGNGRKEIGKILGG